MFRTGPGALMASKISASNRSIEQLDLPFMYGQAISFSTFIILEVPPIWPEEHCLAVGNCKPLQLSACSGSSRHGSKYLFRETKTSSAEKTYPTSPTFTINTLHVIKQRLKYSGFEFKLPHLLRDIFSLWIADHSCSLIIDIQLSYSTASLQTSFIKHDQPKDNSWGDVVGHGNANGGQTVHQWRIR